MNTKLSKLLQCVETGEPLDWPGFRRQLIKRDVNPSTVDEIFRPTKSGGVWRVEVSDQPAYEALLELLGINADLTSRVSAARHGKSHAVAVSGNVVVVKNPAFSHSIAYECDAFGHWVYPASPAPELVIVENLECYLQRDRLIAFLSARCGVTLDSGNVDVAYASGNAITKACNRNWLEEYTRIHCVLDVDAGGLRIFSSLKRLLGEGGPKLKYVIPDDLSALLESTRRTIDDDERQVLMAYTRIEAPIGIIAQTLLATGKTLEQEVYLDESI